MQETSESCQTLEQPWSWGGLGTPNLGLVTSRFGLDYLLSKLFVNLQGIFWTLVIPVLLAYH